VHIQHHEVAVTRDAEAVLDAYRSRDPRPRAGVHDGAVDREFGLALEDIERVDVVRVAVKVDAREIRAEAELEDLELRQLGKDAVLPHPLALARLENDSVRHDA